VTASPPPGSPAARGAVALEHGTDDPRDQAEPVERQRRLAQAQARRDELRALAHR